MSSPLIKDLPYSARLDHAVTWSLANPNESFPTSVYIYYIVAKSIRSRVVCTRSSPGPGTGGQNRVLIAEQATAIIQYYRKAAEYSCSTTRDIVIAAVSYLCTQEYPLKPLPSNS